MANEVYTRTNQALFFARRAIDAWAEAANSGAIEARLSTTVSTPYFTCIEVC